MSPESSGSPVRKVAVDARDIALPSRRIRSSLRQHDLPLGLGEHRKMRSVISATCSSSSCAARSAASVIRCLLRGRRGRPSVASGSIAGVVRRVSRAAAACEDRHGFSTLVYWAMAEIRAAIFLPIWSRCSSSTDSFSPGRRQRGRRKSPAWRVGARWRIPLRCRCRWGGARWRSGEACRRHRRRGLLGSQHRRRVHRARLPRHHIDNLSTGDRRTSTARGLSSRRHRDVNVAEMRPDNRQPSGSTGRPAQVRDGPAGDAEVNVVASVKLLHNALTPA